MGAPHKSERPGGRRRRAAQARRERQAGTRQGWVAEGRRRAARVAGDADERPQRRSRRVVVGRERRAARTGGRGSTAGGEGGARRRARARGQTGRRRRAGWDGQKADQWPECWTQHRLRVCESNPTSGSPPCKGRHLGRILTSEWPETRQKRPFGPPFEPLKGVVLPLLLSWLDCFTNSEGGLQTGGTPAHAGTRGAGLQDGLAGTLDGP